jgi:hypothetical protein
MVERTLEQVCQESPFCTNLNGNIYCRLALGGKKIQCDYIEKIPDKNGLYRCKEPFYNMEFKEI